MSSNKNLRTFNRNQKEKSQRKKTNPQNKRTRNQQRLVKVAEGAPTENVSHPINGMLYVDAETGNTYLFAKELGWIDQSSWQPDVGEGPPTGEMAPPDPMTGDQYIDVISGDFYFYSEGFGWVLGNGTEGPQGPPGPSFSFDLITTMGATGPTISGPLKVTPGSRVQLWINDKGLLQGDVTP